MENGKRTKESLKTTKSHDRDIWLTRTSPSRHKTRVLSFLANKERHSLFSRSDLDMTAYGLMHLIDARLSCRNVLGEGIYSIWLDSESHSEPLDSRGSL